VNFDTNKSDIKKSELADLQKAEAFVKKYSTCKIEIDGYTDSTGNDKINNPLSERRAEAVQKWLRHRVRPHHGEGQWFVQSDRVQQDREGSRGKSPVRDPRLLRIA
jgi:flagellar motor protein MotB